MPDWEERNKWQNSRNTLEIPGGWGITYHLLTQFQPIFHFYIPWKHQKTGGYTESIYGKSIDWFLHDGEHWSLVG